MGICMKILHNAEKKYIDLNMTKFESGTIQGRIFSSESARLLQIVYLNKYIY